MKSMLRSFLNRHPRLKSAVKALLGRRGGRSVSTNYVELNPEALKVVGRELQTAWQNTFLPERQRELVESQLKIYLAGGAVAVFDTLVEVLLRLPITKRSTLLEIGCSSGYYSEVLKARGVNANYRGCDYSKAFIELAHRCYPNLSFDVMDATKLDYGDEQFDVVVSGSCLLHILNYTAAIAETARIAKYYVVFHRTPVFHLSPTSHFTKEAYGVKTIELHFNERELIRLFAEYGLMVIDITTIHAESRPDDAFAVKTYVCCKVPT